jgi:hypothetical protein
LPLVPVAFLALLAITVLWFAADARPLIAFGLFLESTCVRNIADGLGTATAGPAVAIALLAQHSREQRCARAGALGSGP